MSIQKGEAKEVILLGEKIDRPWLEQYPKEIPAHIDYDEKPLQAYLEEGAKEKPNKVLIHFMGKEMTYKEVYDGALRFANSLQKLGVKKGDRVSIMLANTPQSVIS